MYVVTRSGLPSGFRVCCERLGPKNHIPKPRFLVLGFSRRDTTMHAIVKDIVCGCILGFLIRAGTVGNRKRKLYLRQMQIATAGVFVLVYQA